MGASKKSNHSKRRYDGYVPLPLACAKAFRIVVGRDGETNNADTVAYALAALSRIWATDVSTGALFSLSEAELARGRFNGGGSAFAIDGKIRHTGLFIAESDLEVALRILKGAIKDPASYTAESRLSADQK